MNSKKIKEIIRILGLQEHPREGGYFAETYLSEQMVSGRALSTAIYYMLTADTCSRMHRLKGDEIYHFYLGDPVEMLQLCPDGRGRVVKIGSDITNGFYPQLVVPRDVWQGSRLVPGGQFALLGTTMAPGFDYADYESGDREQLIAQYPDFRELITLLTA
jgi:predicted cupin superfamily sugar epimerase